MKVRRTETREVGGGQADKSRQNGGVQFFQSSKVRGKNRIDERTEKKKKGWGSQGKRNRQDIAVRRGVPWKKEGTGKGI